jgi:hypothetical protein
MVHANMVFRERFSRGLHIPGGCSDLTVGVFWSMDEVSHVQIEWQREAARVKDVPRVIGCPTAPSQNKEIPTILSSLIVSLNTESNVSCKLAHPTLCGEIKTNSCVACVLHGPRASLR